MKRRLSIKGVFVSDIMETIEVSLQYGEKGAVRLVLTNEGTGKQVSVYRIRIDETGEIVGKVLTIPSQNHLDGALQLNRYNKLDDLKG